MENRETLREHCFYWNFDHLKLFKIIFLQDVLMKSDHYMILMIFIEIIGNSNNLTAKLIPLPDKSLYFKAIYPFWNKIDGIYQNSIGIKLQNLVFAVQLLSLFKKFHWHHRL